jgi:ligand-binding sensor domain-containing protein
VGEALSTTVYAAAGGERLWAVTAHGVLVAGPEGWEATGDGVGRPLVRALAVSGGALLAATSDGVYRREPAGWRPLSRDLRDTLTLFVLPVGGALFAGTFERGILRSTDGGRSWETVTEAEYRRAIVPAIAAGGDTLVARVEYDRTLQSRDGGATWTLADAGLSGRTVFAVASDGQTFWAGTDDGVYRLDETTWSALPALAGTVSTLLATVDGILAGTSDGLWQWDGTTWRRFGLDGQHVVAVLAGADGRLEFAATSSDGVFRRTGFGWRALGLAGQRINAIARDPTDGRLVVATDSGVWRTR